MNRKYLPILLMVLVAGSHFTCLGQTQTSYLQSIKVELQKKWPTNRTINLVFHGHSVPCGYFATPRVQTLEAYPQQVLKLLKESYPHAVVNTITTSIGGENSMKGEKRFKSEVLTHQPDVLLIDYALNDRGIGLERSRKSMEKMIRVALKRNIKIILLTPSPDLGVDLAKKDNELELFSAMLSGLAEKYHIGLVDSYLEFKELATQGNDLADYMSQVNHPNEKGHRVIASLIMAYFK